MGAYTVGLKAPTIAKKLGHSRTTVTRTIEMDSERENQESLPRGRPHKSDKWEDGQFALSAKRNPEEMAIRHGVYSHGMASLLA